MDIVGESLKLLAVNAAGQWGPLGLFVCFSAVVWGVFCILCFCMSGSGTSGVSATNAGPNSNGFVQYAGERDPEVKPGSELAEYAAEMFDEPAALVEPRNRFDPMNTMRRRSRFE